MVDDVTAKRRIQNILFISTIVSSFALGLSLNRRLGFTTFWVLPSIFPSHAAFHIILFKRLKRELNDEDGVIKEQSNILAKGKTVVCAWILAVVWAVLFALTIVNPVVTHPWKGVRIALHVFESLSVFVEFVVMLLLAALITLEWRVLGKAGAIALPAEGGQGARTTTAACV